MCHVFSLINALIILKNHLHLYINTSIPSFCVMQLYISLHIFTCLINCDCRSPLLHTTNKLIKPSFTMNLSTKILLNAAKVVFLMLLILSTTIYIYIYILIVVVLRTYVPAPAFNVYAVYVKNLKLIS